MSDLPKSLLRDIQIADKYVRGIKNTCLYPYCEKPAIRSHHIPESVINSALAIDNHVYEVSPSYMSILKFSKDIERDIVLRSSNKAGVFKGYCPYHDTKVFLPIETFRPTEEHAVYRAIFLRTMSLIYCRKLEVSDFSSNLLKHSSHSELFSVINEIRDDARLQGLEILRRYISPMHKLRPLRPRLRAYVIPITKNLQVSCSGIFNIKEDDNDSIVVFNLTSYKDASVMHLLSIKNKFDFIDQFIKSYRGSGGLERMFNDIIFLKGEDVLISPRLWTSLTIENRKCIGRALVGPEFSANIPPLDIIKLPNEGLYTNLPDSFLKEIKVSQKRFERITGYLKGVFSLKI